MILFISFLTLFQSHTEAFPHISRDHQRLAHSRPFFHTTRGTCNRNIHLAMNPDSSKENGSDSTSSPTFDQLGLSPLLLDIVKNQGWKEPTPIQRISIKPIIQLGTDRSEHNSIWAEAPTGSGKTAAYVLPLLQLVLDLKKERRKVSSKQPLTRNHDKLGGVTALILSPTRELASQIGFVIQSLINSHKELSTLLNIAVLTGGTPIEPQIDMLVKRNAQGQNLDILVATPGRLIDVLLYHSPNAMGSSTDDIPITAQDKELEKQLLAALDGKIDVADANKVGHKRKRKSTTDMSLSFHEIQNLKINEMISTGRDGGRSSIHNILSDVHYLVLDEADRLLSSGFKNEMDQILTMLPSSTSKTSSTINPKLKTLLFSATFPKQIEPRVYQLLESLYGKNDESLIPLRLLVDVKASSISSSNLPNEVDSMALLSESVNLQEGEDDEEEEEDDDASTSQGLTDRQRKRLEKKHTIVSPHISIQGSESTIDQRIFRMEEKDRTSILRKLLEEYGSEQWDRVLVFVSTRYACEHVAQKLTRANIRAAELHGKLEQDDRIRRLDDFRRGKVQVLIATDLASRGLDVAG